jgi:hypothetical protein
MTVALYLSSAPRGCMIAKHITQTVFWSSIVLTLVSIGLAYMSGKVFLILLGLSIVYNLWALHKSDNEGFVKTNQLRRAYEPLRHFNGVQVLTVLSSLMAQLSFIAYMIVT